jgi:valyl-tRNA synthetase
MNTQLPNAEISHTVFITKTCQNLGTSGAIKYMLKLVHEHLFNFCGLICTQGLINPAMELVRLQKKQDQLEQQVSKLKQAIAAPEYCTRVPEEVRLSNADKLAQTEGELLRLLSAATALRSMQ